MSCCFPLPLFTHRITVRSVNPAWHSCIHHLVQLGIAEHSDLGNLAHDVKPQPGSISPRPTHSFIGETLSSIHNFITWMTLLEKGGIRVKVPYPSQPSMFVFNSSSFSFCVFIFYLCVNQSCGLVYILVITCITIYTFCKALIWDYFLVLFVALGLDAFWNYTLISYNVTPFSPPS